MIHKKPSINVKYAIESWDGAKWITEYECTSLAELEEEFEFLKKARSKKKFRAIRSEWTVIG
jgi:hypothetical protein